MRRFLITSYVLLALFVGAAGAAPAAHATAADTNNSNIQLQRDANGNYNPTGNTTGVVADPFADAAKSASEAAKAAANTPTKQSTGAAMNSTLADVMNWIMSLFAWLLGVAAILLDNVLYFTVVKMGSYVSGLSAVGVTWRIVRDIGNIMFVFGFLSVGIMTILSVDWYGIRKMLPMLLVGAIFLNFSLFTAEVIVDTGNLFATQFYQQINGGPAGAKNFDGLQSITDEGISNKLMSQLGLQRIYAEALKNGQVLSSTSSVFVGFMSIILFLVAAFVMFSLSFILIARFVALVFLIIASPIGFAGLAIPGFANLAKQWWTNLYEQTMVAPVLLLMLYVALAVITDVNFLAFAGGKPEWTGFIQSSSGATNLTGFAGMVLSFLVAMGLLLLVLVYAKRWSAFGGGWATRMGARMSFGVTSFGLRNSVGWLANKTGRGLRSTRIGQRISTVPIVGTNFTRAIEGIGKASFDVRNTGVLKSIPLGSNIDLGKGQKGWNEWEEERIKARMEYAKKFKPRELSKVETEAEEKAKADRDIAKANSEAAKMVVEADKKSVSKIEKDIERMKNAQQMMSDQDARYGELTQKIESREQDHLAAERKLAESTAADTAAQTELLDKETKLAETKTNNDKAKSGAAAQIKYAENLTPKWITSWGNKINPYRNEAAAKRIKLEAGKDKSQKEVDALKQLLEAATKKAEATPH